MGGAVNVVIRESNGKVSKMCRWTNSITYWLHSPEFLNNPDKVLREYIEAGSKSEYNHDKVTLSPDGYGLIVIDAVHNLIMSHQEYTSFEEVTGARYALNLHIHHALDFKAKDAEIPFININKLIKHISERNNAFKNFPMVNPSNFDKELLDMKKDYDFFMMGGIRGDQRILKILEKENEKKILKSKELTNYQEVYNRLGSNKRTLEDWEFFLKTINNHKFLNMFAINLGSYKVIDYMSHSMSTLEQWAKYKENLKQLGFVLTSEDEKDWITYLNDYEDE